MKAARLCRLLGWASLGVPILYTLMSCGGIPRGQVLPVLIFLLVAWVWYGVPAFVLLSNCDAVGHGRRGAATAAFVTAVVAAIAISLLTIFVFVISMVEDEPGAQMIVRLLTGVLLTFGFVVLAIHTGRIFAFGGGGTKPQEFDVAGWAKPAGIRAHPVRSAWVAGSLLAIVGVAWGAPEVSRVLGDVISFAPPVVVRPTPPPSAAPDIPAVPEVSGQTWDGDARTQLGLPQADRAAIEQSLQGRPQFDGSRLDLSPHRWKLDAALRKAGHKMLGPYSPLSDQQVREVSTSVEGILFPATHALLRWVPEGGYTLEYPDEAGHDVYAAVTAGDKELWPGIEAELKRATDALAGSPLTQAQAYSLVDILLERGGHPLNQIKSGPGRAVGVVAGGRTQWIAADGRRSNEPSGPRQPSVPPPPGSVLRISFAPLIPLLFGTHGAVLIAGCLTLVLGAAVLYLARQPQHRLESYLQPLGRTLRWWAAISAVLWLCLAINYANSTIKGWSAVLDVFSNPWCGFTFVFSLCVLMLLGWSYPKAFLSVPEDPDPAPFPMRSEGDDL